MPTKAFLSLMVAMVAFSPMIAVRAAAKSEYTVPQSDKTYLAGAEALRVSAVPEQSPLLGYNKASGEITGATGELMRYITERTGIRLEITPVGTVAELASLMQENKLDMVFNVPCDEKVAQEYGIRLTEPYFSYRMQLVRRNGIDAGNLIGRTIARPAVYAFEGKGEYFDAVYYDRAESCFRAVDDGRVDFCYMPEYCSTLFAGYRDYKDITVTPQDEPVQSVCIGISPGMEERMAGIIERVVDGMPEYLMSSAMMRGIEKEWMKIVAADSRCDRRRLTLLGVVCVVVFVVAVMLIHTTARSNRRMRRSNDRYALLTDLANEFTFDYDYVTRDFTFSEKCAKAFGCPLQLKNESNVLCRYAQGTMPRKLSELILSGSGQRENTYECELLMLGGEHRWFRIISTTLRDEHERKVLAVGKIFDVQLEIQEKTDLMKRLRIDGLTGIFNAAASRELIGNAIKSRAGRGGGAIWIIDIDRFKQINDTLGHDVGDEALRNFSGILSAHFRKNDIVGRLGGDEFIVWMADGVTIECMQARCEALCKQVRTAELAGAKEKGINLSISIGVAMLDGDGDFKSLYKRADKALYQAKEKGRDGYVIV